MKTPFSKEQFLGLFEQYNSSVFPAQFVLILFGIYALWLIRSRNLYRDRIISLILSLIWLWNGLVYQLLFFTQINKAAVIFGLAFSVQAMFMLVEGVVRNRLTFALHGRGKEFTGFILILYGLVIYPFIDLIMGHSLTGIISLGLPCPSTIMTFGFFLMIKGKFPAYLLIIPFLWGIMGLSAALNFGIYQDIIMVLSAFVSVFWILRNNRFRHSESSYA